MIEFRQVKVTFGERTLLRDVNFAIHAGHKVGVTGRNGAGKTTLFSLLLGRLEPAEGSILYPKVWQVAWLDQHVSPSHRSALDFVMDGDQRMRAVQARIHEAEMQKRDGKLGELYSQFEDIGGYQAEARAGAILSGLGFSKEDFPKPHREFSGGWRIRLNLARTLMTPSDLLLLDEPTNHLDLETTLWLERWLLNYEGTLLTIAHDRDFLNRVTNEILNLEHLTATHYRGNFDSFERQRAATTQLQQALFDRQEQERKRIQRFVDRFRYKATKARQVQSRIKALDRMTELAPLRAESPYSFHFHAPARMERPMVSMERLQIAYGSHSVIADCNHSIYPGDRIGILGLNGSGKTSLLKVLAGELAHGGGEVHYSRHCKVGYFAQHQLEILNGDLSVRDHLVDVERVNARTAFDYLGRWGFHGKAIDRKVKHFSGGEKARLVLALLARQNPSLLLLDEPSNHLDLEMRDALAVALQEYAGAFLLVAHDRQLLQQCVDEYWLVTNGTVVKYLDGIDAYTAMLEKSLSQAVSTIPKKSARDLRRERANARANTAELRRVRTQLEKRIDQLQLQEQTLTRKLADRETFTNASREELQTWLREHAEIKKNLAGLEDRWLEVESTLSEA